MRSWNTEPKGIQQNTENLHYIQVILNLQCFQIH